MRLIAILFFIGTSNFFADASAAPITVIDQQNPAPAMGTQGGVVFGQSFIPTLPSVDAFEVLMGDDSATVVAQILNGVIGFDGLAGPVIGTSDPVMVSDFGIGHHTIHFDFPLGVAVIPGQTYVAEFFATSGRFAPGIAEVSITTNDSYNRGLLLEGGFPPGFFSTAYDLIFSEGLTTPIPEPSSWVIAIGFLAMLYFHRHFRN